MPSDQNGETLECRIVVGFAGPTGSGKTTGALYLAQAHSFGYVRYSEVLQEWNDSDQEREVLQSIGWSVMSSPKLQSELNRKVISKMQLGVDYAVDGLRHPVDQSMMLAEFASRFFLLYIESDFEVRRARLLENGRFNSELAFQVADEHPVERPLRKLRDLSFAVIRNDSNLAHYELSIDRALRQIRASVVGQP